LKRNNETDGYFTVEAAFIVPMALAVLVLTIYMTFFAWGRCRMVQDALILSIRESSQKSPLSENRIRGEYGLKREKYPFFSSVSASLSGRGGRDVTVSGQMRISPMSGYFLTRGRGMGFTCTVSTPDHDPPARFRKYRRLTCLAGKLLSGAGQGEEDDKEDGDGT
jgi:hypothetical protein